MGRKAAPAIFAAKLSFLGPLRAPSRHKAAPTGIACGNRAKTTTARKRAVVEVRQALDQLRAARTLAVMASTEPTPSMWLYFGLPALAADSFW